MYYVVFLLDGLELSIPLNSNFNPTKSTKRILDLKSVNIQLLNSSGGGIPLWLWS